MGYRDGVCVAAESDGRPPPAKFCCCSALGGAGRPVAVLLPDGAVHLLDGVLDPVALGRVTPLSGLLRLRTADGHGTLAALAAYVRGPGGIIVSLAERIG